MPSSGLRVSIQIMNPSSNLYLIGPMGAGKSTVGRRLARQLNLRFVDLDQMIEAETGSNIPLLFEIEGEAAFRQRESEALQRATRLDGVVLATGGGSILAEANREHLRQHGFVVYLEAPVELQLERLARDHSRPLLRAPDRAQRLRELAQRRNPIYEELADLTITADRAGPGATARRALAALKLHWQLPAVLPASELAP
jgi:shikimate kinase